MKHTVVVSEKQGKVVIEPIVQEEPLDILINGIPIGYKGEKGDKGDRGEPGMDGKDGKNGVDGIDGIGRDGKDGVDGKDGKNGVDGKDGIGIQEIESEDNFDGTFDILFKLDNGKTKTITTPDLRGKRGKSSVEMVGRVGPTSGTEWFDGTGEPATALGSNGDFYIDTITGDFYKKTDGTWTLLFTSVTASFETVSKNLSTRGYTLNYTSGDLTSIIYTDGTDTITKTFNYTSGDLTSIVLSGDTPSGIDLTKTLSYTGGDLTSITYT